MLVTNPSIQAYPQPPAKTFIVQQQQQPQQPFQSFNLQRNPTIITNNQKLPPICNSYPPVNSFQTSLNEAPPRYDGFISQNATIGIQGEVLNIIILNKFDPSIQSYIIGELTMPVLAASTYPTNLANP